MNYSIEGHAVKEPDGFYTLRIREGGETPLRHGRVSLSRIPNHDFFTLGSLANKGGLPKFEYIEGVDLLFGRIVSDIQSVIAGKDPSIGGVDRGPIWPQKGAPPDWAGPLTKPKNTAQDYEYDSQGT
jgi:hypothetical protein